ncbi:hypothetical protein CRG98_042450 [Punica granatum]|uniref:Uncharacterized protein n=1 Tax=Punica granatum TaxID=22663 RepID=A0A2I0HZH6_PUNGR|nr:hypothetical protein CRG98_042450 [Punica granatum]
MIRIRLGSTEADSNELEAGDLGDTERGQRLWEPIELRGDSLGHRSSCGAAVGGTDYLIPLPISS